MMTTIPTTMMPAPTLARRSMRCALALLAAAACRVEEPLPSEDASGTSAAGGSSSGGGSVSATSTTGRPPTTTAGATSDASSTASGGSADETGLVFIMPPDGGVCVHGGAPDGLQPRCWECDLAAQDCVTGEKCVPWANDGGDVWNATRCSPIPDDPAGLGEPCVAEGSPVSGIDDCELGALCFAVDPDTLQGTCIALCDTGDPDACGDAVCMASNDYAPYVCVPRCDPLDPATCTAEETCRPIGGDVVCVPTVTLPQGLPCGAAEQSCATDQACMGADELASCEDVECCRPWCDLTAPDPDLPCTAVPGEVCRPFVDAPPAGFEHVGVCGLPPA